MNENIFDLNVQIIAYKRFDDGDSGTTYELANQHSVYFSTSQATTFSHAP